MEERTRLTDEQLETFFLARQNWQEGDSFPENAEEVARWHIYPNLGNAFAANFKRPKEDASYFQATVEKYTANSSDPEEMIDTIITEMFKRDFKYNLGTNNPNRQAISLFARRAANKVYSLLRAYYEQSLGDKADNRADSASAYSYSPVTLTERVAFEQDVRKQLDGHGDQQCPTSAERWLVLFLLHDNADYTFPQVETAFVSVEELRGRGFDWLDIPAQLCADSRWSSPDDSAQPFEWQTGIRTNPYLRADWQPNQKPYLPRHPCFVWYELKWGYALPEWLPITDGEDAIHCWFTPNPVNANALERRYYRGMERIKRKWKSERH